MNISTYVTIETQIRDVKTGKKVGGNKRKKNLILDGGLNAMAKSTALGLQCTPATATNVCLIGSGSTANSISSGGVTFTQSGTTITASGSFFTSGMTGNLFKYGTGSGGAESYITFVNATTATSSVSATVSTPTVATVWFVARTTLDTFLFASSTYQTNSGDCGSTISGNQVTHKRTYIFAQQASPYSVNEIGYASGVVSNRVLGRVVLGSTDNVGTSNFYVVIISLTVTYSPSAPTSVGNVGTNINTAGTFMIEVMNCTIVTSTGSTSTNGSGFVRAILDNSGTLFFKTASYSQNGSINPTSGPAVGSAIFIGGDTNWVNDASKVGSCTMTMNSSLATTGQTLFGIGLTDVNHAGIALDILFTTPQTAPTGTFQPNTVWRLTYTRTLVN